jgi:3-hydroxybutyryl-CoA dehydrogenase
MNLVVVGNDAALAECKARFGDAHHYTHVLSSVSDVKQLHKADVVFDFFESGNAKDLQVYSGLMNTPLFINSVFTTLSSLLSQTKLSNPVFGFCGLPGFFNREIMEVSVENKQTNQLTAISEKMNFKYIRVKDQVGMVTPRVVGMIINEAFETLQNGVASKADIDLSMKLGTNYPFGPFEWAERIGRNNLIKLLLAVEKETGDSRYKPVLLSID